MDNKNILLLLGQEVVHVLAELRQQHQCWTVVIFPLVYRYLVVEWRGIVSNAAEVVNPIIILMLFLQVAGNSGDVVSVDLLEQFLSRIAHGDNPGCDVGQI